MKPPTMQDCAVEDLLKAEREFAGINAECFSVWDTRNFSNDLNVLETEMADCLRRYNNKLDELKAEINATEVNF